MPHATQEVTEPDFRIRCWRHQDSQTHWEVFLKKRAFSQGNTSKLHPQTSPGPSTKQGERIFTSKNFCFGNGTAPPSDSFLVLAAKLSWGPGGFQARPHRCLGMGNLSGVCTWKLLGGNFPDLAGPGHSLVLNSGGWGYTCSFCCDECVGF